MPIARKEHLVKVIFCTSTLSENEKQQLIPFS